MKEENAPAQHADADLPPQIQTDQCLLEAEKEIQTNDAQTAKTAFQKIQALNIEELPSEFFFLYGKFLMENCNVDNPAKAVENGQVQRTAKNQEQESRRNLSNPFGRLLLRTREHNHRRRRLRVFGKNPNGRRLHRSCELSAQGRRRRQRKG